MPEYTNSEIGASFKLPTDPDLEQLTQYDIKLREAFGDSDELPTAEYCGAVVFAAAEAGLIESWNVSTRPGVPLSNKPKQSGRAVMWAARCIELYIRQVKTIDPKSLAPASPARAEI